MRFSSPFRATLLASAVFAAACAPSTEPVISGDDFLNVRLSSASVGSAAVGEVCKYGPDGTSATFTVSVAGAPGTLPLGSEFTLPAAATAINGFNCRIIFVPGDTGTSAPQNTVLTVTETGATEGTHLIRVVENSLEGYFIYDMPTTSAFTVTMNWNYGAVIRFKNDWKPEEPPPTGTQGCTPGYWKQTQHFDSWTAPYTPNTLFDDVFDNAFPGKTLLQVLGLGGGDLNALGRHTVAALLNASAGSGVDYGMSAATIIADFNAAFASGQYDALKNQYEAWNERGCNLN